MDDRELLREYADHGTEAAFARLVERHAGPVYAAARRQVKDPHHAQDITQAVFIALARKARGLPPGVVLAAWLHRATRFAVLHLRRTEGRRRSREQAAMDDWLDHPPGVASAGTTHAPGAGSGLDDLWERALPLLDDALASLSPEDREALMLRFMERLDLAEVGRRLGRSEDAAKKRVARGLEKLRLRFRRRGVPLTVAGLADALDARADPELPPGLTRACVALGLGLAPPPHPHVSALSHAAAAGLSRPLPTGVSIGAPVLVALLAVHSPLNLILTMKALLASILVLSSTGNWLATTEARGAALIDRGFQPALARNGNTIDRLTTLPDGRVLATGRFDMLDDVPAAGMALVNPDGTVSPDFRVTLQTSEFLAVQTDGRVLVRNERGLGRLRTDGRPEAGFQVELAAGTNPAPGTPSWIAGAAEVDPQHRILVAGAFDRVNGVPRIGVARLLPDGTVDPSFDPGQALKQTDASGVSGPPNLRAVALQPDGRVLITGQFATARGRAVNSLVRLLADGSVDANFATGTGARRAAAPPAPPTALEAAEIGAVHVFADGRIVLAGDFTDFDGAPRDGLARLRPDGSLDVDFDPPVNLVPVTGDAHLLAVEPNGSLYVTMVMGGQLRRITPGGVFDGSFRPGLSATSGVLALAVGREGRLFVGEMVPEIAGVAAYVRQLEPDGQAVPGVRITARSSGRIRAVVPLPDGRTLVGGEFARANRQSVSGLIRLNANGQTDTSFTTRIKGPNPIGGAVVNPTVWHALPQSDGKIILTGYFESVAGVARLSLARLLPDGSLDRSYVPATWPLYTSGVALQSDDRLILVDPVMKMVGAAPRRGIARLNPDGSLDAGFDPGQGIVFGAIDPYDESPVRALAVQADGRILLAGALRSYDGVARTNLLRLEPNGSLDAGFDPGSGIDGPVHALALHAGERIVLGGTFTRVAGQTRVALARLQPEGSVDSTFAPVFGRVPGKGAVAVRALLALPGGRLLVGGGFSSVNGVPRNGLARLEPDGSLDTSWDPGSLVNFGVGTGFSEPEDTRMTFALASDGSILIGGALSAEGALGLFRLLPPDHSRLAVTPPRVAGQPTLLSLTGEEGGRFRVEASPDLRTWIPLTNVVMGEGPTEWAVPAGTLDAAAFFRAKAATP